MSESSSSDDGEDTWISWFCALEGHEMFCEVERSYIEDGFNLYGLRHWVPSINDSLDVILDRVSQTEASHELMEATCALYGLIHARFVLTTAGLEAMYAKYTLQEFGNCPHFLCRRQPVVPLGVRDEPHIETVKLYCPKCQDIYMHPSHAAQRVDGAYFGTTFPHLFFMTYGSMIPDPPEQTFVPRVFGFRVHASAANGAYARGQGHQHDQHLQERRRVRRPLPLPLSTPSTGGTGTSTSHAAGGSSPANRPRGVAGGAGVAEIGSSSTSALGGAGAGIELNLKLEAEKVTMHSKKAKKEGEWGTSKGVAGAQGAGVGVMAPGAEGSNGRRDSEGGRSRASKGADGEKRVGSFCRGCAIENGHSTSLIGDCDSALQHAGGEGREGGGGTSLLSGTQQSKKMGEGGEEATKGSGQEAALSSIKNSNNGGGGGSGGGSSKNNGNVNTKHSDDRSSRDVLQAGRRAAGEIWMRQRELQQHDPHQHDLHQRDLDWKGGDTGGGWSNKTGTAMVVASKGWEGKCPATPVPSIRPSNGSTSQERGKKRLPEVELDAAIVAPRTAEGVGSGVAGCGPGGAGAGAGRTRGKVPRGGRNSTSSTTRAAAASAMLSAISPAVVVEGGSNGRRTRGRSPS